MTTILPDYRDGEQPDVLVIVEFERHVQFAIKRVKKDEKWCFFACTVPVAEALQQAGMVVYTPLDFTDDEVLKRYGEKSYQTVDALSNNLDNVLCQQSIEIKEKNIRPFYMEHYRLKALCDGAVSRITELLDVFDALEPKTVLAFVREEIISKTLDVDVVNTSLYGNAAVNICQQRDLELICASDLHPFQDTQHVTMNLFQRINRAFSHKGVWGILTHVVGMLNMYLYGVKKGKGILALQSIIPDECLAKRIPVWRWKRPGTPVWRTSGRKIRVDNTISDDIVVPSFGNSSDVRSFFVHRGIEWFSFAETYLNAFVRHELPVCLSNCRAADELFQVLDLGAVVATNLGSASFLRHVAARALNAGVPVIVQNHGAVGFQRELSYYYQEFRFCSHYLLNACGGQAHLEYIGNHHLETKVVGSIGLQNIAKPKKSKREICKLYGFDPEKPLIIFPSPEFKWRNRQLIMATENEFRHAQIQNEILDAVLECSNVQIILKGLPGDTLESSALMRRAKYEQSPLLCFANDRPFGDFLDAADCFIMDMPSTMLLEAMTRDHRIYAFNQCYVWEKKGLDLLEGSVHVERECLVEFCASLKADIKSGLAFEKKNHNGQFFKAYGDSIEDGKAEERIVEALVELTQTGKWAS